MEKELKDTLGEFRESFRECNDANLKLFELYIQKTFIEGYNVGFNNGLRKKNFIQQIVD